MFFKQTQILKQSLRYPISFTGLSNKLENVFKSSAKEAREVAIVKEPTLIRVQEIIASFVRT